MFNRLVHSSTRNAVTRAAPSPADFLSLRIGYGMSFRIYILCGVFISIMPHAAFGAIPFSDSQGQSFNDMPAVITPFRRGEEAVHHTQFLPVPGTFVGQHAAKSAHANIGKRTGKAMILHHAVNVQVLDGDKIKTPYQVRSDLVQIIRSTVSDVLLNAGNVQSCLLPSTASLGPAGKRLLSLSQFAQGLAEISHVGYVLPIGQRGKAIDAEINADALAGLRQGLNFFIKTERDEVFPGRFLDYRYRRGFTLKRPAPMDIKPAKTSNTKVAIVTIPLEGAAGVFSRLLTPLLFENWIFIFPVKKPTEGSLQMPEGLLNGDARCFVQPSCSFFLFQRSKQRRCFMVADALMFLEPCIDAKAEKIIVDKAARAKDAGRHGGLLFRWVKTIAVSDFHIYNLQHVTGIVKPYNKERSGVPLPAKAGSLHAEESL